MNSKDYVLGVDYGTKRIGLALTSVIARLPSALGVLSNVSDEENITQIQQIISDNRIGTIVVGLPRNLSGDDTEQTRLVREFADKLDKSIDCPVVLQDEAGTSAKAEDEIKTIKNPSKGLTVDSLSAVYILEDYLKEKL